MGGVRLRINQAAMTAELNKVTRKAALRGARSAQKKVRNNMRMRRRTGRMIDSVHMRPVGANRYRIYSLLFYTTYQEHGIGPVTPKKAKVLRFKPKGSSTFVFATRTRGFKGGFFFKRAVTSMKVSDFTG